MLGGAKAQMKRIGFHFKDSLQRSEKIPIKIINNLVIVPMKINGSDTLNFIIDTGLRTSLITDLSIVNALGLKFGRQTTIRGLGEGEAIDVIHTYNNTIDIEGVRGYYQNLFILIDATFNFSDKLGIPIHGIIGYEFFEKLIIEVDYVHKNIIIHNPKRYKHRRWFGQRIPILIDNYKPYIDAKIEVEKDQQSEVRLLLDLGASDALWIFHNHEKNLILPQNNIRTFLGRGLSGVINGSLCRIATFEIGKYKFKKVIAAFPDTSSIGDTDVFRTRQGSIGGEVLRRFDVVIDYPHQTITLKPNRHYSDRFTYNVLGIEVHKPYPAIPYYEVAKIFEASPAIDAGLREGDRVIAINFRSVYDMNLNEINQMLRVSRVKKIRIRIVRNGEKQLIKIRINEII